MRLVFSILVVLLSVFHAASVFSSVKAPPVEIFSNLPDVRNVELSPNGKKLLSIIRIDAGDTSGTGLQLTDLATGETDIVLFSDNSKYFVGRSTWKDSKTILVYTWYPSERDTWTGMRQARYKTREGRLLFINTETGAVTSPFSNKYLKRYKILPTGLSDVVDLLPEDPDHVLMSIPSIDRGWPSYPKVVKVNIAKQQNKTIQDAKDDVYGWGTDATGNIRMAYRIDDKGGIHNRVKDASTKKWREIGSYQYFSEDEVNILGFDVDPNIIYINAYHQGFMAVFKVDLRDKELNRTLVHADPNYDVSGYLVYSPKRDRVIGIGSESEGGTVYIDPEFKVLQASIDKALPDTRNFIYSITDDEKNFVVYSTGPTESGTYYLGSRSPLKLTATAYRYNKLPPQVLGKVETMTYKARDGLEIEAYLTLPNNVERKPLPTLMFPHGGPISRDSKAFDYWAQFFASRGYAVLQMNFRGSAGQGFEFRNSGLKKWGKEMQDDIEDGAIALIEQGITDPEKICIVGASYGGYAALMGVAKTPDRYKCAISVNGVSNVFDLVKDNRAFWLSYNVVDEQIGNDGKTLRAISPVNLVDKIKAPVLLIHGELDRQVEIKHSYQMRDALEKSGKSVVFVEQAGEDHYLSNEKMRVQAFKLMDDFLKEHLPVDAVKPVEKTVK